MEGAILEVENGKYKVCNEIKADGDDCYLGCSEIAKNKSIKIEEEKDPAETTTL